MADIYLGLTRRQYEFLWEKYCNSAMPISDSFEEYVKKKRDRETFESFTERQIDYLLRKSKK